MNTDTDMWVEFAKSFGMLFAVLAFFLVALYLVRRFSGRFGTKGAVQLIKVLSVHHLSPKEKLVLVSVRGETVLIGVSPAGISSLACFGKTPETESETVLESGEPAPGFQNLLKKSLVKGSNMPLERDAFNSGAGAGKGETS